MDTAQCCNAGIMYHRPLRFGRQHDIRKALKIVGTLTQKTERRRCPPTCDCIKGDGHRGWRRVDSRMRRYRQELMDARPRDSPRHPTFGKPCQGGVCHLMPRRILAMGIDKDVRVNGNHTSGIPYAASRISCHPAFRNARVLPLPLNVTGLILVAWHCVPDSRASESPSMTIDRNEIPRSLAADLVRRKRSSAISMVVFISNDHITLDVPCQHPALSKHTSFYHNRAFYSIHNGHKSGSRRSIPASLYPCVAFAASESEKRKNRKRLIFCWSSVPQYATFSPFLGWGLMDMR